MRLQYGNGEGGRALSHEIFLPHSLLMVCAESREGGKVLSHEIFFPHTLLIIGLNGEGGTTLFLRIFPPHPTLNVCWKWERWYGILPQNISPMSLSGCKVVQNYPTKLYGIQGKVLGRSPLKYFPLSILPGEGGRILSLEIFPPRDVQQRD